MKIFSHVIDEMAIGTLSLGGFEGWLVNGWWLVMKTEANGGP